ncbi:hypothetical protein AMTRI_Chr04g180140 [Amborella trichopoda]
MSSQEAETMAWSLITQKWRSWERFVVLLVFLSSLSSVSPEESDDGATLLEIKKAFRDVDNVLYDWTGASSSEYCSWRGITCDNMTFDVVSLNLSGLNLDGEISPAIGNLKGLLSIDLRGNHLLGQIPDEIGGCSSLTSLDLSFNDIYGDIPFSISKLKQLEYLILKNNQLMGPIPSTLSQLPNLKILDLAQNNLSGEIPRLIYWNEVLQFLGLRGNNFVGTLSPDICQLTGLWYFDVRNNSLTGSIPENIGNCTGFQVLYGLILQSAHWRDPIQHRFFASCDIVFARKPVEWENSICDWIDAGTCCTRFELQPFEWADSSNFRQFDLYRKIVFAWKQADGAYSPRIGELNDNQLTGQIPSELGKLTELFDLNLANNYLEGPIPENLSSCVNLNSLNLSMNNLKGVIPIELSRISNLDTLDISSNKISGSIPSSIGDLEHLLKLNLSRNRLVGFIPLEFGNLRSVLDIDVSSNDLFGRIPQELSQLQDLISLRVEYNNLTGDITSLSNCLSLSFLNVSYNDLVGDIPVGNNFSRFHPESFLGNPGLCGYWVGSPCHPYHSRPKASVSRLAILGISLGSLLALLTILLLACRPQKPAPFPDGSMSKPVTTAPKLVILHMNMALHVYDDIMRMTENLSEKYIIGYGASSTVYKCVLKNCKPVAIKRIYTHFPQSLKEFETELEIIGNIKHRNLVSLQGYSLSPCGNLLFYDYMENGSLWDLLHGPSKMKKLDWVTRVKIALGAAHGLAYLHHDCNPRIVHRDVKTSNILLDSEMEAHLTDFGIAKSLLWSKAHTSTYVMGTIGYIDPEYARTSRLNEKSDVYSYGIVLLELLTGMKAVDNESNLHHVILSKAASNTVMDTVDPEILDTCKDLNAVKKVFQLALLCTKRQPSDRPTMHEVTRVLGSLVPQSITDPKPQAPQPPPCVPLIGISSTCRTYMDEYANLKNPNLIACTSLTTTDGHLFVKFGEVISQNTR